MPQPAVEIRTASAPAGWKVGAKYYVCCCCAEESDSQALRGEHLAIWVAATVCVSIAVWVVAGSGEGDRGIGNVYMIAERSP